MKDFDHASIVARYKSLQEKYPNEDPRILLKDIFSQNDLIQADFSEDITFTELGLKRTDPQKKGRWITTKAGNKVFIVDLDVRIAEQIEELEREKNNFILEDRQRLKRHINNLKNLKQIKNETFRNSAFNQEKKAIQSFLRISSEYHEKPLDKAKRLESEIKRIRQRIQEGYKENLTTFSKENQDSYKKKLKNLVEVYNKIPLDIRIEAQKKESTFTSLGLKRKADFSEDIVDKDKWKKTLQETTKKYQEHGLNRSQKSISMDKRKRAKKIVGINITEEEWRKRPNLSDKEGVDTPDDKGSIKSDKGSVKSKKELEEKLKKLQSLVKELGHYPGAEELREHGFKAYSDYSYFNIEKKLKNQIGQVQYAELNKLPQENISFKRYTPELVKSLHRAIGKKGSEISNSDLVYADKLAKITGHDPQYGLQRSWLGDTEWSRRGKPTNILNESHVEDLPCGTLVEKRGKINQIYRKIDENKWIKVAEQKYDFGKDRFKMYGSATPRQLEKLNPQELEIMATESLDIATRLLAIKKLKDIETLKMIAITDESYEAMSKAYNRIKELDPDHPYLAELRSFYQKAKEKKHDFMDYNWKIYNVAQKTGDTLDMVLWEVAQDFEQVREDFLSLDAYAQSKMPGSKYERLPEYTRLQERQKQLQQYEKAYQSEVGKQIRAINPNIFTPMISAISIPFELTNSETGAVVQGSVLQSFEKNTKELTPVSSSNVRGVGQFGNELLVQFHPSKGTPMRTYRYMFDDPQQAAQAYQSLTNTGSPGRWVWQNLRGHIKGEPTGIKVVPHKYGPSLSPPGQGLPTIGGTTASLVDYEISNRTPTSRVANFDEMAKQMRRNNANPSTNPQTGSGIEALLGTREGIRELGLSPFKMGKQLSQLPDPYGKKRDFVILEEGDITKDYLVQGHWKQSKYGKRFWTNEYNRGEGINAFEKEWTPEEIKEWDEWERSIKERNELAKEGETINPQLPMSEHQKKAYLQYRDTKFFTKRNYRILDSLSDKLMISRAIDPIDIPLEDLNYIFYIDDCFKELPQSIQDSITEVRIYPKAYEDPLWGDESYSGISGFWVPSRKSVTIGMYKYFHSGSGFNLTESKSWLNEVLVHEGAHALDDTKLSQKEIKKKRELYRKYKGRLSRHYAGKNEDEFFAESFTYNYLVRNDKPMKSEHHEKLMETETDINFFINSIIDKYDFLRNLLWEKIEVLET